MCETFEKKDTCNEIDFGGGNRRGAWSGSSDCPQGISLYSHFHFY